MLHDGFLLLCAALRRLRLSSIFAGRSMRERLEAAWLASSAATQLADAALLGETTPELAARIARIARRLSRAQAAAVFGRGFPTAVLFGKDGEADTASLADRALASGSIEWTKNGTSVALPLVAREGLVGALTLRFAAGTRAALHSLAPLLRRAGTVLAAAEREARKDRFLSLAAHELKTPLTSIKGFPYSLARRLERGEMADARSVQVLERQAERLHGLLEEMLEVSRLEMGRFVLHQEPCELAELVESALRSLRRLGSDAGALSVPPASSLPLSADRERIERAIAALLLRARSHGGEVSLALSQHGGRASLRVAWQGLPLPDGERETAFAARWEAPPPLRQGLGMALFVARHCVALHGGELRCEPNAFVLELPLRAWEFRARDGGEAGRVLVVDDDEPLARMLAEFFADNGYAADWTASGRNALEKLARAAPDLLVLDLRMPELDGRALLAELRAKGAALPRVLLLSSDRELASAAAELKAQAFVEKPFAPENLLAAARRALER